MNMEERRAIDGSSGNPHPNDLRPRTSRLPRFSGGHKKICGAELMPNGDSWRSATPRVASYRISDCPTPASAASPTPVRSPRYHRKKTAFVATAILPSIQISSLTVDDLLEPLLVDGEPCEFESGTYHPKGSPVLSHFGRSSTPGFRSFGTAGIPTATSPEAISFVATAIVPSIESAAIVTPARTVA